MSTTQLFTWALAGFVIVAIAVFDIYIIFKKGKEESISAYIIRGSRKMPLIVFSSGLIIGILLGHLLWSMDTFDWMPKEEIIKKCESIFKKGG